MSQVNLVKMADILLPIPPEQVIPIWFVFIMSGVGVISIVIVFFLLWYHLTQPLALLERHLKQDKLSPREAAHLLASLVREKKRRTNIQLLQQIDHLRFQRQAPKSSELLSIINRVKHGR